MKCICGFPSHINPKNYNCRLNNANNTKFPHISLQTIKTTTDFKRTPSSIVSESFSSLNISPNKRRAAHELKKVNKKLNYEEVIQ